MTNRHRSWIISFMVFVGIGAVFAAVLAATRTANASLAAIDPLTSPPTRRLAVANNCGWGWNPTCRPRAVSYLGLRVTSYFYIDGRYVGSANANYTNVCARFGLSNGYHSARTYARDSRGNVASTGVVYRAIKCDRTRPYGTPGISRVSARPRASDAISGVASRRFYVDYRLRTWRNYSNLCATFRLYRGRHIASVRVADRAGNVTIVRQAFYCR